VRGTLTEERAAHLIEAGADATVQMHYTLEKYHGVLPWYGFVATMLELTVCFYPCCCLDSCRLLRRLLKAGADVKSLNGRVFTLAIVAQKFNALSVLAESIAEVPHLMLLDGSRLGHRHGNCSLLFVLPEGCTAITRELAHGVLTGDIDDAGVELLREQGADSAMKIQMVSSDCPSFYGWMVPRASPLDWVNLGPCSTNLNDNKTRCYEGTLLAWVVALHPEGPETPGVLRALVNGMAGTISRNQWVRYLTAAAASCSHAAVDSIESRNCPESQHGASKHHTHSRHDWLPCVMALNPVDPMFHNRREPAASMCEPTRYIIGPCPASGVSSVCSHVELSTSTALCSAVSTRWESCGGRERMRLQVQRMRSQAEGEEGARRGSAEFVDMSS